MISRAPVTPKEFAFHFGGLTPGTELALTLYESYSRGPGPKLSSLPGQ